MVEIVAPKDQIEPEIAALLAELKSRLERRFGERLVALYLFGSRAVTPSRTAMSMWQWSSIKRCHGHST